MRKKYTIQHIDGITEIRCDQAPTYNNARAIIDDIAANFPYEKRLWDFSNVDFDFTMEELRSIAEYGKMVFTQPNKVALVATKDLVFGELRAFEVYRDQVEHATARVFRTRQEALAWLKK
jgi:hypothetical protein